ncbi:hypothetical protein EST38_g3506 [Candolleomyces aberdarensis]|uniref:Uncharacterized protein n=1 Tax=Candolleomyces aberdarensis TaxID=2316362 RepID=A0A4Q2DPQ4_9AGAR|nr:hypothetical protein EST38_g3506 [Candolleomyces aberdarensis]
MSFEEVEDSTGRIRASRAPSGHRGATGTMSPALRREITFIIGETADVLQAEMQTQDEKMAELQRNHQENKKQLAKVSRNEDITSKHLERVETCLSEKIQVMEGSVASSRAEARKASTIANKGYDEALAATANIQQVESKLRKLEKELNYLKLTLLTLDVGETDHALSGRFKYSPGRLPCEGPGKEVPDMFVRNNPEHSPCTKTGFDELGGVDPSSDVEKGPDFDEDHALIEEGSNEDSESEIDSKLSTDSDEDPQFDDPPPRTLLDELREQDQDLFLGGSLVNGQDYDSAVEDWNPCQGAFNF